MNNQLTRINLLPQDEFESSFLGKFLKWAVTYGRYIVVITELIVVLAFLSRFKLDRDLNDLTEEIGRKKNIITASASFETEVRDVQNRLAAIKKIETEGPKYYEYLDIISSQMPPDVVLSSINFSGQDLVLVGKAKTEAGISSLIESLKRNPKVRFATIESLTKGSTGGKLDFQMKVQMG